MKAELEAVGSTNDTDLALIRSALTIALKAFEEATAWMLAHYDSNPREAAAGAVPYLKLTGIVTGGWQMARSARIARQLQASVEENAAFLRAKIFTARFYAEHVLPEVETYRDEITMGATATLALEEASF